MSKWTRWIDIEEAMASQGPFANYGVYQIRAVNERGHPIKVARLARRDQSGLLYIGRSGYACRSNNRTIAKRLREFAEKRHCAGRKYALSQKLLACLPAFKDHRLQARAKFICDSAIDRTERQTLQKYFKAFGELPPLNGAMPRGK